MRRWAVVALTLGAAGCGGPPPVSPGSAAGRPPYEIASAWLCRPDLPLDACRGDLDATELRPDGTTAVIPFVPAASPSVDCFYVYPTVDMGMFPGNHGDFADLSRMNEVAKAQVARFGRVCRVFAPLYRQVTIGTYFAPATTREELLAIAFSDVLEAFRWYLAHAQATQKVVLVGHSQGAEMIIRLLRTFFDDDSALRARLVVAMPIGSDLEVPDGQVSGGTLASVPLCRTPDEPGCIVTFRTYPANREARSWTPPPPPGHHLACVNPADVAGNERHWLSGATLPTRSRFRDRLPGSEWAKTPFLVMPDFYAARCMVGPNGFHYLAVEPATGPGDTRKSPVDFDLALWRTRLGMHLLDMQLSQGDLVSLVARKVAALAR
jgi:hypothetical protein